VVQAPLFAQATLTLLNEQDEGASAARVHELALFLDFINSSVVV
jgi:hypothetical protein